MSFTGFKSVLIFSLLLDGPKSYQELQKFLENHEYLHEKVSIDTIRIYINSLKEIGCNVIKKRYDGITKYSIDKHPFSLKFNEKQIKNIIKIYKAIINSIEVSDLLALQEFFTKISDYIDDENLKTKLLNISPISNIDKTLINELLSSINQNAELTIYYNSSNSGKKNIKIISDKLFIENGKLYLAGFNSEYENYSNFLVSKIIKIVSVNINNKTIELPELVVQYKYLTKNNQKLNLLENEKLIEDLKDYQIIEIKSRNKFEIVQRIMSLSTNCIIISPDDFKKHVLSILKQMKEGYIEK
jgi:predicted DNA-binding transcriptional regulator YafY